VCEERVGTKHLGRVLGRPRAKGGRGGSDGESVGGGIGEREGGDRDVQVEGRGGGGSIWGQGVGTKRER